MHAINWALEQHVFSGRVKITNEEPSQGLWFKHMSPVQLTELRPLTYSEIEAIRPGYNMFERRQTEIIYHDFYRNMPTTDKDTSFLYGTVVGFNTMAEPNTYPGFTYYFQLTDAQISQCVFTIVDKKTWRQPDQAWMRPTQGMQGLNIAKSIWIKHNDTFVPYEEENLGTIDPRIEVIIPFAVLPEFYFPQEKDRK